MNIWIVWNTCWRRLQILDLMQEQLIGRSIISHTKYRLKSRDSIVAKMIKKKRELTEENVFTYINDLAGIRVICLFLDDIYRVRDFITRYLGFPLWKKRILWKTEKQWLSESARNRAVYRWKKSRNSAANDRNGFLVGAWNISCSIRNIIKRKKRWKKNCFPVPLMCGIWISECWIWDSQLKMYKRCAFLESTSFLNKI